MKIMHISDLHLGITVNGINMIEDQKYSLNKVLYEIDNHKVDVLVIAGDIYDKTNPSLEAINLFNDFINKISLKNIYTLIISGNHDSSIRLEYLSSFLKKAKIFISKPFDGTVEKVEIQDEYGYVNFYLLPYFKLSMLKALTQTDFKNYDDAIKYLFKDKLDVKQRNILVAHQYVNGASISDSEEVIIGGLDGISYESLMSFDYVALGHLHKPQFVNSKKIRYCGTLIKYSFSETGVEKSIPVIDLKKKDEISIQLIPLDYLHDLKEIKGNYNDLYNHIYTEDYVKIILTDEEYIIDARSNLLSVFPNMMIFKIENSKTSSEINLSELEKIESFTPLDLFNEFYKVQNNNQCPTKKQIEVIKRLVEEEL